MLYFYLYFFLKINALEWQNSPFFDTRIIKNKVRIKNLLIEDGFQEGFYQTKDGLTLPYLFKKKDNAAYNLIIYVGCAGRSTDCAPFAAMLADEPCNLLFVGGRNNQWSWRFNTKILDLGEYSHQDIQAALDYVQQQNDKPIILLGSCAGSFYATRAMLDQQYDHVKGLIIDSGWADPAQTAQSVMRGVVGHFLDTKLLKGDGHYYKENRPVWFKKLVHRVQKIGDFLYENLLKKRLEAQKKHFNIAQEIQKLTIPMLFIHSYDDYQTPIAPLQELAQKAQKAEYWWIEKSKHCCHHLKHKEEYKKRLINFIRV